MLTKSQGTALLKLARKAVEEALKHKTVEVPLAVRKQKQLQGQPGVFVTLLKNGELRGSMGYPQGTYPLIDGLIRAARDAAFSDPRFKAVKKAGLQHLRIRIDVLSGFRQAGIKSIRPGKDGVFIEYGPFRALLLPEDAKKFGWTARETVKNTLRKAGLASEMWNSKGLKIYTFKTQAFEEMG